MKREARPIKAENTTNGYDRGDKEKLHVVLKEHSGEGDPEDAKVVAVCLDLEDANRAAHQCVEDNWFGNQAASEEYKKSIENDGLVEFDVLGGNSYGSIEIWIAEFHNQRARLNELEEEKKAQKDADWKSVYLVMLDHTHPEFGDDTKVIALCPNLEEANRTARHCLEEHYGSDNDWEEYDEDIKLDGDVRIEARGFQDENFVVRIDKILQKLKATPKQIVAKNQPSMVFVVTEEHRINVCSSNEEGEIDNFEIDGVFKDFVSANAFVRSLAKQNDEDVKYEINGL